MANRIKVSAIDDNGETRTRVWPPFYRGTIIRDGIKSQMSASDVRPGDLGVSSRRDENRVAYIFPIHKVEWIDDNKDPA